LHKTEIGLVAVRVVW